MAQTKPSPLHPDAEDARIFDADVHLNVHIDDLVEGGYVDDPIVREKLEKYGSPPVLGGVTGTSAKYAKEVDERADHILGRAITADELDDVADELGADEMLLTPGNYLPIPHGPYPEVKRAVTKAYNDYLMEEAVDPDRGIYGALIVPDWDVEHGLEELDRYGDEDAIISAFNWFSGYRPWGHESHDPLNDKLVELDLPLQMHFGGLTHHPTSLKHDSKRTYVEHVMLDRDEGAIAEVLNIVFTGLFDKYPDLDIVINENGTTWIPHLAYRADNWYQNSPEDICMVPRMKEMGKQYLDKMPSEYIFENMYTTTVPIALPDDPQRAKSLLDVSRAEDTFVFATDWPHSAIDGPNWVFDSPAIDGDLQRSIFHENAEDVYRFPS